MPTTLDELRSRYAAAPNESLLKLADPARRRVAPLSAEAWLALTEELERRGLPLPEDPTVAALLDDGRGAEAPPRDMRTGLVRYPRGPLGRRFVAMVIDWFVVAIPMAFVLGIAFAMSGIKAGTPPDPAALGPFMAAFALMMLVMLAYGFFKDGMKGGQSLGKRTVGLMVVRLRDNRPCTYGSSALRALVMLALGFVPILGVFIEPVVTLFADDGRRLGDRAAETQVIAVSDYRPSPEGI